MSGVKTYLPLEYHSAVEVYKGKRKNATIGSGIVNIIKQFFPLKARSDIQLKKFVQVLTKIEIETNNLSALKMKNASKELMSQQEDIIYRLSKDLINLMYLMAYTADDLYEMLPKVCHPTLQFSLNLADRKDRELKSSLVNMVTHVN